MFDKNTRLVTRGISERLPLQIIAQIWLGIETQLNAGFEMDYLQVFKFNNLNDTVLAITQEQEVPERKTVIYCEYQKEFEEILNETVYVIDDGDHSTMLFATEY